MSIDYQFMPVLNLEFVVKSADIVVGAVGKSEFIKGKWIQENAVVIDGGYHPGGVGDIELQEVIS